MPTRAGKGNASIDSTESDTATRTSEIKQRLKTLEARQAVLAESQERIERERAEVAAAIVQAKAALEAVVSAPVAGGQDPTLWLPDELLLLILVYVVLETGTRTCSLVCRRWQRLCQDRSVMDASGGTPWDLYAEGKLKPRMIRTKNCISLAPGHNRKMYCGTSDGPIEVRSQADGSLLQTLTGHCGSVWALTVGLDGALYSGSIFGTIRVWSGESGAQIRTLEGHTDSVLALVTNEANLFSGSDDASICVWQCSTGNLIHKVVDVGGCVTTMALGKYDRLYFATGHTTIQTLSVTHYTLLDRLEGHGDSVRTLITGHDGTLFSGSYDGTIRVWSEKEKGGSLIRTLINPAPNYPRLEGVEVLALAPNGNLISVSPSGTLCVWRTDGHTPLNYALSHETYDCLAFTCDGHLWAAHGRLYLYF